MGAMHTIAVIEDDRPTSNQLAGWIVEANRTGPAVEWAAVWIVPMVGCAAALVVFVVLFKTPDMTGPREA